MTITGRRQGAGRPGEAKLPCRNGLGKRISGSGSGFARPIARNAGTRHAPLLLQHPFQAFDLVGKRIVVANQVLDLPHGVQNGGVVAPAESAADFRQ